ncbi:hypothetical protein [Microvirga puerhi]|nr:hypothetical protein [Microvirga puerhi]
MLIQVGLLLSLTNGTLPLAPAQYYPPPIVPAFPQAQQYAPQGNYARPNVGPNYNGGSAFGGPPIQRPAVQPGFRCATQALVCMMGSPGPVGGPCTCPTPYGFVPGQIIN